MYCALKTFETIEFYRYCQINATLLKEIPNFVREMRVLSSSSYRDVDFNCQKNIDLFSTEFRGASKGRILILCSAVKV